MKPGLVGIELHLNNQPKERSGVGEKERETEHLVGCEGAPAGDLG